MHISLALFVDDLAKLRPTGNRRDGDAQWQVDMVSHFHPGHPVSVTTYVTAEEAQRVAAAWAALAADLAYREAAAEADRLDDERAATVAALSPDAEAVLARALGNEPGQPPCLDDPDGLHHINCGCPDAEVAS